MEEKTSNCPDVKNKVMEKIKEKKITIICPAAVWARKFGQKGALVAFVLWGGFLLNAFLYFLEHTHLFKFLGLGIPGFKAFISEIPYGYLALFFLSMILAAYLAEKSDFCYQQKISSEKIIPLFFAGSVLVGAGFLFLGVNGFFQNRLEKREPMKKAVWGRVLEMDSETILIEEENGRIVRVEVGDFVDPKENWPEARGRFLRAVGERRGENLEIFRAESVLCCDED